MEFPLEGKKRKNAWVEGEKEGKKETEKKLRGEEEIFFCKE